ncbi:hypothetical protein, partial [Sphingobacterium kyonggiense]
PWVLEIRFQSPYLCTTPQGRDGRTATETREGKDDPKGRFCTAIDRKKGLENYFKINFAEPKKPSTFAVPTTGNGTGRDARSRN